MVTKSPSNRKQPVSTDLYCNAPLALYACQPHQSRGRLFNENESPMKTPFQRDRDRIIHAGAFRKLKYKTQVFIYHIGDYYRTRLTHSIEVAQIARSIARALNLDEDLAESVALAHDLGHTPFGHAGEDALNAAMKNYRGFEHNDQTLRILTQLEKRYADFDGLNLTWETLEGVVKHNGPLNTKKLPATIKAFQKEFDLELTSYPSLEAQVAALSDDIAYNNHDIDDGLRAGLFTIDDLKELPLLGSIITNLQKKYPDLERSRLVYETIRRMINDMVTDLIATTRENLAKVKPKSADDVRYAGRALVEFSPDTKKYCKEIRSFLMERMYRHYTVNRMCMKATRVVQELFEGFMAVPGTLPTDWQQQILARGSDTQKARIIADYIAGMTDNYALLEHERLLNPYERP